MSLPGPSDEARLLPPFSEDRRQRIRVYDRRSADREAVTVDISGLDFNEFLQLLSQRLSIPSIETFCLMTTDRTVLDFDKFQELKAEDTLYIMQTRHQELPAATKEQISFTPHYDTLVRSGMYEYYASKGQMPLPYALAELIDNSVSATARNTGERTIELRLMFDDTLGKPAVVFLDNGSGMTSKQLNNWAVYRLSKYKREDGRFRSDRQGYVRPEAVSRSINSDISCFGVGGKQAIFYIGNSTRMITRPTGSPDVHELILSKEDFETKENNKEDIFSGVIHNRKVGDSSHVQKESELFLHSLIAEETEKESFTAVVITGIPPDHISFLKNAFEKWTRELAHIYHYYIHGYNGNVEVNQNCDIQISLRERPNRLPSVVNLREVDNDMQTLYINSTADEFEFKAHTASGGTVDGVLRYHPFLYDRETYPQGPNPLLAPSEDEVEDGEYVAGNQANRHQHIFECFWNGRLIPYTTIAEFEWCKRPSKRDVPVECYSRFSGVLFADDRFQVSTNKLTFIDLDTQLHKADTTFKCIVNGQEQRLQFKRAFSNWLTSCHERLDKQIHFMGFKEKITREDVQPKKMQFPWATFSSIEWDNKTYRTGQLVKSLRTQPILYGCIVQFLLYGDHDQDVYATRGVVEVCLEPKELNDERRTFLISKIDRTATNDSIQRFIDNEMTKMPDKLQLEWPQGNDWSENAVMPASTLLGPLKVSILNKKGEAISRIPSTNQGAVRKLAMQLRLVWHGPNGAQEIQNITAQHATKWGFWFKAMETLTKLGKYTLELNTMLNDHSMFCGKTLPSNKLNLTITEGKAESFRVEGFNSTLHVGVAFDMVLTLMDAFGHQASPPPGLTPQLSCRNLSVSYEKTSSSVTQFIIHGVTVCGSVPNYHCKARDLTVVLPDLESSSQTLKISLLPGNPHSLDITSEKDTFTVENGNPMTFNVKVHDEAGNITAQPQLVVYCRVPQHVPISVDCSTTGAGQLTTKPINVRNLKEQQRVVKAKFDLPSQRQVSDVWKELLVVPSTRVCRVEVYCQDAGGSSLVLRNKEQVEWKAGDVLENLHYRLYDEGQRLLPVDKRTACNMKVNWSAEVNLEDLARGKLPSIQVPTQVKKKPFYYQVSYKDQRASVDASFVLVPCPDVPSQLKVTLEHSTVMMGEVLPGEIHLQLLDQHGNLTQKLTPQCAEAVKVKGEELDSTSLTVSWQESSRDVVVRGVVFRPGPPGPQELTFTLRTFVEQVKVTVTAGPPTKLELLSGPQLPLQVFNEQCIPSPFLIQLCDAWGNPSPDQRVVVALTSSSPSLKVTSAVMSKPVDQEGKASFTVERIAGPKGEFSLEFRGLFNQKPIPGPSVPLTLVLDPSKPASLVVDYDTNTSCPAGGALPVFSVSVLSEEGGPIRNVNPAALSMMLWRRDTTSVLTPPSEVIQLKCSRPLANEDDDFHFHFRDKLGPEQTGSYSLQFSLTSDRTSFLSKQYVLDVVANEPTKLAPDSQPNTPMVSNVEAPACRVLVEDLTLKIRDRFGNPAGQEVDGQVEVRVELSPGDRDKELPILEPQSDGVYLQLTKGTAHVSKLSIIRNSPGSDRTKYVLVFQTRAPGTTLAPYLLPFHFYNDADNQRRMSELSRNKDRLSTNLVKYKDYLSNMEDLRRELTSKNQQASSKVRELGSELSRIKVYETPLKSGLEVREAINEKTVQLNNISRQPRRTCSIKDPYRGIEDVLGKVCHLALVEDDEAARVISWHIQGDLDCLITTTTAAARQIYDTTGGAQQVLPLDSVYVNPTDRPLPHYGCRTPTPPGNPMFARDLLIYPDHRESCQKVFKNLLADTILIDDLDAGNAYRKSVVQSNRPCPTILTRRGERIGARGKFGGSQNRAPQLSALQGRVFAAPLPAQYHTLHSHINHLQGYLQAIDASNNAKEELNAHVQKLQSPANTKMKREMDDTKRKLTEIESQLERSPRSTPGMRALVEVEQQQQQEEEEEEEAGEAAGPPRKRTRASARRSLL